MRVDEIEGTFIYTWNTVKLGPCNQLEHNREGELTMSEIDIELTAACDRLRIVIRNEQQLELNAAKWRAMGQTSTIQRRLKNEANGVKVNVSFNKR